MSWILAVIFLCLGCLMVVCGLKFWHGKWAFLVAGVNAPQKGTDEKIIQRTVRFVGGIVAAMGVSTIVAMILELVAMLGFPEVEQIAGALLLVLFGLIALCAIVGIIILNLKQS